MYQPKDDLEQRALELFREGKDQYEVLCVLQEEGYDYQTAFRTALNGNVKFSREQLLAAADFYLKAFRGQIPLTKASDYVEYLQLSFHQWADAIEVALRVADKKIATLGEALRQLCDEIMDDAMEQLRQDLENEDDENSEDPECE